VEAHRSIALLEAGLVAAVALNHADPAIAAFWDVVFDAEATPSGSQSKCEPFR